MIWGTWNPLLELVIAILLAALILYFNDVIWILLDGNLFALVVLTMVSTIVLRGLHSDIAWVVPPYLLVMGFTLPGDWFRFCSYCHHWPARPWKKWCFKCRRTPKEAA